MILKNPFLLRVRVLYAYNYECWECGQNGTQTGGMSLHHIVGRSSASAFNSAPVCGKCHTHMGHTVKEQRFLFDKTQQYLLKEKYEPVEEDWDFIRQHRRELGL